MPVKKAKKVQSKVNKKAVAQKRSTTKKSSTAQKDTNKKVIKKLTPITKPIKKVRVQASEENKVTCKNIKQKKVILPIAILLLVLAAWFLKSQFIVAMVDGKPITRFQVIKQLELQGGSQILESLITQELVKQAIKEADVEVDQAEIDSRIAEVEESLSAQGQDFNEILKMQNLTRSDVEKDLLLNLQVEKLLADKVQVTDEEVIGYFETNKEFLGEGANFAEMKEQIEAQVKQEKATEARQAWLEELSNEANITYFRFKPALF